VAKFSPQTSQYTSSGSRGAPQFGQVAPGGTGVLGMTVVPAAVAAGLPPAVSGGRTPIGAPQVSQ
jgi:hypothetical protein